MAKRSRKKKAIVGGASPANSSKETAVPSSSPDLGSIWVWGSILVVIVFLTYIPVWWAGYIWDDDTYITANPVIIGPLGLKEIWTTAAADICPLTMTTFWIEHALWGLAPLPYHLVNVLMHAACAVLLWRALTALRIPGAWFGAALWALHPVQVESVAWITELKNTQSCLFYLLSILSFVKGLRAWGTEKQSGWDWNYALTLLFAAMAMTSKSSTVILPLVLGLVAWWVEGRWNWRSALRIVPTLLISFAISLLSTKTEEMLDPQWSLNWAQRAITAGDAIWFYLGKLIWPYPLIAIYPRWQIDPEDWTAYLPLAAALCIFLVLWLKSETWLRPCFFAFTYFVASLLPVLGIIEHPFLRYSFIADHFQYLAAMGPLALAAAGLVQCANLWIPKKPWQEATLAAGMLLLLGGLSWQRCRIYENAETFWADTLAKNPSAWAANTNLGNTFLEAGHLDKALAYYQKSLSINPRNAVALSNLGIVLLEQGKTDDAVVQLQKAVQIEPNYPDGHSNLGLGLAQKGELNAAMDEYQKALQLDPTNTKYRDNLGKAYAQAGQIDEAIDQYQKALAIQPDDVESHYDLAAALAGKGQIDDAIAQYKMALEVAPTDVRVLNNLSNLYFQQRQFNDAILLLQKALETNPDDPKVHNNLGAALTKVGSLDKAIVQFQEAIRLDPSNRNAQTNLAHVQAMVRQQAGTN